MDWTNWKIFVTFIFWGKHDSLFDGEDYIFATHGIIIKFLQSDLILCSSIKSSKSE